MSILSIYHQNVRGLRTKTHTFIRNVLRNSFDVITLTETWLIDGVNDSEIFDDRYLVWRRDRNYSRTGQTRGGGVLIAVKKDFVVDGYKDWCSSAEDVWVELTLRSPQATHKLYICTAYIIDENHGYTLGEQLVNFSEKLTASSINRPNDRLLILGDFNMPNIMWHRQRGESYL